MSRWLDPYTSLNVSGLSGTAEGSTVNLRTMLDRHAMHVFVSGTGSPEYTIQLQGEWREGHGFAVLAEVDQSSVPLGSPRLVVVEGKPSRAIRAVCVVTSGTVSPVVSVSSAE